jgi:colicin import membrane protein
MPFGLTLSFLLHVGAIAWAYLAMAATAPLKPPEPEPITVAIITPSELLALKKGSETAKELEAKAKDVPKPEVSKLEAEKPKPVTAQELPSEPAPPPEEKKAVEAPPPEPPKQEPPKAEPAKPEPPKPDPIAEKLAAMPPEPPPGPTPDELKKAEEEKKAEEQRQADEKKKAEQQKKAEEDKKKAEEEKKKADEKRKAEEKKKAEQKKKLAEQKRKEDEKKKKQQQADRLAALLDKDPTRKGAPNSAAEPQNPTDYTGPTAGAREGDAPVLSVREQDLLRSQISQQLRGCWKLPGGGGGIETMVVTVRWRLRPDGSLEGEPALDSPQSGAVYQIAAEAAIRAVKMCSPFTLPPDRYWAWKSIIWDFDPREMM